MGLSSKKTTSDPWKPSQPYIIKGMENSNRVFDQQQPQLDRFSGMQMDTYGRLAPGAEQGILGSQSLVNDTLAGKYLNSNPYIDQMLSLSNRDVADTVNSQFAGAGRYGSGAYTDVLARQLADNETRARFGQYNQERQYQNNAVGQAQSLMGGATGLLNNAADLPWIGVGALNGNIRQASQGYGTTTQSGGLGTQLLGIGGSALSSYLGRNG